ncbi:hypothetical protein CC1G_00655 [Coprinopsis cinerea okayama7|uniref:Uncharacterized protein n=1 Tax=Coprinopsis cinerea (strain Okayama-7 / 130 / ATCC MYA-4618 / FGSC 9003) TaxID=240176 RepID=A8N3F1_COPC7|nr:hypothetical protein CC1G_00655 [Coprinopsis cinerea okayama7\|eukprot:XP_001829476.2 hypothetical protein CC1G_00655 [Coprinopsis cinerea okayama7\
MTLLGGLFSRKSKGRNKEQQASSVASAPAATSEDIDSTLSSPTASYVTPDKHVPSVPNGKSYLHPDSARDIHTNLNDHRPSLEMMPSTSKLRIFGRKKSSIKPPESTNDNDYDNAFGTSPRPPYMGRISTSSAASDSETADPRRLRPPPSKSAIFAAYNDPHSALSTRSLPNEGYHTRSESPQPSAPPPPPTKRPSLFSWTKSSSSKALPIPPKDPKKLAPIDTHNVGESPESSFNLKSFRHVGPSSPAHSNSNPNASNVSLHTPAPRPRAEPVHSDSSHRISVAAFREAQARRSLAGSPSPSLGRSPSPLPNSPSLPPDVPRGPIASSSRPPRPSPQPSPSTSYSTQLNQRKSGMSFAATSLFASDTDDSDSSSEHEESDDDGTYTQAQRGRQPTSRLPLTHKGRAKSDMGHGAILDRRTPTRSAPKSHVGHDWSSRQESPSHSRPNSQALLSNYAAQEAMPTSESGLGHYAGGQRPRASASTSALTPSAAAKRASVLAAANAGTEADTINQYKRASRHIRDSSIHSNPPEPPSMTTNKKASTNLGHGNFPLQQTPSSDSDSDSDNAPLATLVPPRRPGSAMSSYSNGNASTRSGGQHKPLIDIKELVATKPAPSLPRPAGSPGKSMEGFTPGRTLLSGMDSSSRPDLRRPPSPTHSVVSKIPPVNFISPPSTPGQEEVKRMGIPPRSSTMPLPMASSSSLGGNESTPDGERKRDALSERLSKVVKSTVGPSQLNPERSNSAPLLSISRSTTPVGDLNKPLPPPESPSVRNFLEPQRSESPKDLNSNIKAPVAKRTKSNTLDIPASTSAATIRPRPVSKPSPPDPSLADLLGVAGMKLISRNGEDSPSDSESETSDSSESDSDGYGYDSVSGKKDPLRKKSAVEEPKEEKIVPIPIKQRQPAPSFSVTSRPPISRSPTKQSNALSTVSSTSGSSNAGSVVGGSSTRSSMNLMTLPSTTVTSSSSSTFNARKRSSTLATPGGTSNYLSPSPPFANGSSSRSTPPPDSPNSDRTNALRAVGATIAMQPQPRQRSSTLVPMLSPPQGGTPPPHMPSRPFAVRRDSPASSTGDSSSGRAPLTPRDGSDIGINTRSKDSALKTDSVQQYSGGASGLGMSAKTKQKLKRRSVSFDDEPRDLVEFRSSRASRDLTKLTGGDSGKAKEKERRSVEVEMEERRKERRREEAKAAIELGEVVNGRGPILDDDDDLPMNPRMSTMNPMMMGMQPQIGFPGVPGGGATWGMNMNMNLNMAMQHGPMPSPGMLSPAQFMLPQPASNDPAFLAAHQQAMMIAKQAYQMAVAQQAMAAAADEWERSSNMGGFGGSVYGGVGGSGGSVGPGSMITPYGMGMGMMGMGQPNNWSTGSAIMGPSASSRSMYGGMSSSRSEYGGGMMSSGGGRSSVAMGNWSSSRSSYGEIGAASGGGGRSRHVSTGARDSIYGGHGNVPPVPAIPSGGGDRSSIVGSSKAGPRQRTTSQPALSSGRAGHGALRKAPPPSSWKASGF